MKVMNLKSLLPYPCNKWITLSYFALACLFISPLCYCPHCKSTQLEFWPERHRRWQVEAKTGKAGLMSPCLFSCWILGMQSREPKERFKLKYLNTFQKLMTTYKGDHKDHRWNVIYMVSFYVIRWLHYCMDKVSCSHNDQQEQTNLQNGLQILTSAFIECTKILQIWKYLARWKEHL